MYVSLVLNAAACKDSKRFQEEYVKPNLLPKYKKNKQNCNELHKLPDKVKEIACDVPVATLFQNRMALWADARVV